MVPVRGLVVAGYDGSHGSEAALQVAVREATLRGGRLLVVSAWHAPSYFYGSMAAPSAGLALGEDIRKQLEKRLEQAVAAVRKEAPGLEVESRLVEGVASAVLTREAADAELLVVGSRGIGGFRELLLGSVSHQCAQHAACPVLIVPAVGAAATL